MQMIILLLKQHICHTQYQHSTYQVHPMRQYRIRTQVDKPKRHHQLHSHIQQRYLHMTYLQFIRHQLIRMLPMRFPQILMQQDTMTDGQATIHSIYQQQNQIRHILCHHHQPTDGKQHDKRYRNASHVSGKALRLTLRTEVEQAEHQYPQDSHHQIRRLHKIQAIVQHPQWYQHRQGIAGCNAINTIHEVDHVRSPHTNDERNQHNPPHLPVQDTHAPEHQSHGQELHHQTHTVR